MSLIVRVSLTVSLWRAWG